MAKHIVKCPICGEKFDTNALEDSAWLQEGRRYYHRECYESNDKNVESKIINYCREIMGPSCNIQKIKKQLLQYQREGKSYMDVYMTLQYWYDIKGADPEKANGGIGIVGYIYNEAKEWQSRQERIEQRAKEQQNVKVEEKEPDKVTFYTTPIKKPKRVHLFDIH